MTYNKELNFKQNHNLLCDAYIAVISRRSMLLIVRFVFVVEIKRSAHILYALYGYIALANHIICFDVYKTAIWQYRKCGVRVAPSLFFMKNFVDHCVWFFSFWPLHCLSFDLRLLITPLTY